jgi:hypothetical protein
MATVHKSNGEVTVHGRTPSAWAETAMLNAITRAGYKETEEEATVTLLRGVKTAEQWLNGTHAKLNG